LSRLTGSPSFCPSSHATGYSKILIEWSIASITMIIPAASPTIPAISDNGKMEPPFFFENNIITAMPIYAQAEEPKPRAGPPH